MNRKRLLVWCGWMLTTLTILGIGVMLLPYFWMVSSSLKTGAEVFELPIRWIPQVPQWQNFRDALSRGSFGTYFYNSGVVAVAVTAANVLLCSLAGYGLAKFRFPYRELSFRVILSTLMLPLEVTLVPTFLIVHSLGWLNTYQGIFAPLLVDAFGIFLMRQFVLGVPSDYLEAARIDGAGELRILWKIVLPQCKPVLAVLALFAFRDSWDQFLWPLAVVSRDEYRTYPLGLVRFAEDYGNPQTEQMAVAVMATIPVFVLFLLLQRLLKRGFGLTGLKG